jgi:hypothetical protein
MPISKPRDRSAARVVTGSIDKLTFKLAPKQISAEERNVAEQVLATAHD